MAVAVVQTATPSEIGSFVASTSVTLTGVVVGNGLRVTVTWYLGGGSTVPTISDNGGNSYTKLIEADGATTGVAIYLCKNVTTGGSLTITGTNHGGNTFITLGASEVSGQDTATQAGATNSATGASSTTPSAGSITPAAGSLAVAAMTHDVSNSPTLTAGSGWTIRDNVPGTTGVCLGTETRAGAGASVAGNWTTGAASSNWSAVIAEIQAGAAAPSDPFPAGYHRAPNVLIRL